LHNAYIKIDSSKKNQELLQLIHNKGQNIWTTWRGDRLSANVTRDLNK